MKGDLKIERAIHQALMAQDHYFGMGEIDCWGVTTVDAQRNPAVLADLIDDGRFGDKLGATLHQMILRPYDTSRPPPDHEIRLLHSNGHGYALVSIARQGHCKLAVLVFQRGPNPFTSAERELMFKALAMAERLIRRLLNEQIEWEKGSMKKRPRN